MEKSCEVCAYYHFFELKHHDLDGNLVSETKDPRCCVSPLELGYPESRENKPCRHFEFNSEEKIKAFKEGIEVLTNIVDGDLSTMNEWEKIKESWNPEDIKTMDKCINDMAECIFNYQYPGWTDNQFKGKEINNIINSFMEKARTERKNG